MRKIKISVLLILSIIMLFAISAAGYAKTPVSLQSALEIALRDAGLSEDQISLGEIDGEEGRSVDIEFSRTDDGTEYEYEISAGSGKILEKSVEYRYKKNASRKKIGKTKARKIVSKAAGVSVKKIKKGTCKYKYKKNQGKYTIKFRHKNYKYKYVLMASDGKIIEYEYEYHKSK